MQGSVALQLFPYGWDLPDGTIMREREYRWIVDAANASYFHWVNPHAHHATFERYIPLLHLLIEFWCWQAG